MGQEHWEYYQDEKKEWRSRFVASNGRILFMSSESYRTKGDMTEAIDILEKTARDNINNGTERRLVKFDPAGGW